MVAKRYLSIALLQNRQIRGAINVCASASGAWLVAVQGISGSWKFAALRVIAQAWQPAFDAETVEHGLGQVLTVDFVELSIRALGSSWVSACPHFVLPVPLSRWSHHTPRCRAPQPNVGTEKSHPGYQSHWERVRDRTIQDGAHQGLVAAGHRQADDVQAGDRRIKDLAAAQRHKSVAEGHHRCQIQRRHRGHPNAGKPRRLITSSPKNPA